MAVEVERDDRIRGNIEVGERTQQTERGLAVERRRNVDHAESLGRGAEAALRRLRRCVMRKVLIGLAAVLSACAAYTSGTTSVSPPTAGGYVTNAPPSFGTGSRVMVQLTQPLGSGISYPGERFTATVAEPV